MRGRVVYGTKPRYFINDVEVSQAEFDEAFPSKFAELTEGAPGGHLPSCWPMVSEALAVHPKQIAEATARNKRNGVNVTYDAKGRAILPDRGARRDLLRLEGFHDNQGGYND